MSRLRRTLISDRSKRLTASIYHLADAHGRTDLAKSCASYFGDDLDLLILNGDITEVGSVGDYESLFALSGEITYGGIPVLFSRGNHDTRGEQAERCNEFYPDNKNRNYYRFSVGILAGVILDCGEDKYMILRSNTAASTPLSRIAGKRHVS